MKKLNLLILFSLIYSLTFAQSFEGIVKMNLEEKLIIPNIASDSPDRFKTTKNDIVVQLKGDISRIVITDKITDDEKIYVTNKSTGEIIEIIKIGNQAFTGLKNYKTGKDKDYFPRKIFTVETVTKTGKSKTINGYVCYEYAIKIENGNATAWATSDIKLDLTEQIPFNTRTLMSKKVGGVDGFIMEMKGEKEDGSGFSLIAVIKKQAIDDTIFFADLNEEALERLDKQRKMAALLEELQKELKAAAGDQEKLKQISEEFTKKMNELKN